MSTKDLAAKYGKSKNSTQLVNAAIRAEIPGGGEAIDALDRIRASDERRGTSDTADALAAIRSVVNAMADEIRSRYGMPPREE
ncbi:MAG TPA: hypothetical protein VGI40_05040 [Pirellulaceae bacterium]|jgi:hypothetical protein